MRRNTRKSNQRFMWGIMVMAMAVLLVAYLFLSVAVPGK